MWALLIHGTALSTALEQLHCLVDQVPSGGRSKVPPENAVHPRALVATIRGQAHPDLRDRDRQRVERGYSAVAGLHSAVEEHLPVDILQPIDRDPVNTRARGSTLTRAKKREDPLPDLLLVLAFFLDRFGDLALKPRIHLAKVRARPPRAEVEGFGEGLAVSDLILVPRQRRQVGCERLGALVGLRLQRRARFNLQHSVRRLEVFRVHRLPLPTKCRKFDIDPHVAPSHSRKPRVDRRLKTRDRPYSCAIASG